MTHEKWPAGMETTDESKEEFMLSGNNPDLMARWDRLYAASKSMEATPPRTEAVSVKRDKTVSRLLGSTMLGQKPQQELF